MKFHVSHKTDGVYQALFVEANSQEIAEAYLREKKPDSKILGIHVATMDDMKPGKPVMVVPDEFRLKFIREHQRAFLEKMAELEKQGFRSGGWDEMTDKTAIVKAGEREIDNVVVGYMDRNLNIEWEMGEAGFLQLKKLKDYGGKILGYCKEMDYCISMISALEEDLAVDIYQDTQPGGGNCARDNRKSRNAFEERLVELSGQSVFGELYEWANADEQLALDALLDAFSQQYADTVFEETNLAYQMVRFMECVCDLDYAEKAFTAEDIAVLTKGGERFLALVDKSWYVDKEEFTFIPNVDTAIDFLIEEGLLQRSKFSVDELISSAKQVAEGVCRASSREDIGMEK